MKKEVPVAVKRASKYGYRTGRTDKYIKGNRPRPVEHGIDSQIYPGAEYTPDEIEFMLAMDRYKRDNKRPFPTWHEVLQVLLSLGYSKPTPTEVIHAPETKD